MGQKLVREQPWEQVSVDEATRLRLNGESKKCMEHVCAIKKAGGVSLKESDGCDTSKDQPWDMDTSFWAKLADAYDLITTGLWLLLKLVAFAIPCLVLQTPALLVAWCYMKNLKYGTDTVERRAAYWLSFSFAALLFLPAGLLVLMALLLDYVVYWIFGIIYCILTCRYLAVWRSMRAIDPYRNGPWIILHMPDLYTCVIGQVGRQGFLELNMELCAMWLVIPWIKYYMACNPWLHDLDHRFTNQISTACPDIGTKEFASRP